MVAARHGASSAVRALAAAIAESTGARLGALSEAANSAGGYLAGVVPHRGRGGESRENVGFNAAEIPGTSLDAVLLFSLEPDADLSCCEDAGSKLELQGFVAAFTPFVNESLERSADLLLPIGTFAETSGTFVNCEARWQSFSGIANPVGEARPGWKVLRVLGNLLDADGFDYETSEDVRDELVAELDELTPDNSYAGTKALGQANGADAPAEQVDVPIYEVDAVVRRASALQLTPEAKRSAGDAP